MRECEICANSGGILMNKEVIQLCSNGGEGRGNNAEMEFEFGCDVLS